MTNTNQSIQSSSSNLGPKRILLVNVHSALNLGDDAIMASTLRRIAAIYPCYQVTVAAGDPASWRNKYASITVLPSLAHWGGSPLAGAWRKRLWMLPFQILAFAVIATFYRYWQIRVRLGPAWLNDLLQAYYDADVILSCGGGNFYAYRRFSPSFLWSIMTLWLAIWLGKPVTMLPQSFGPVNGKLQRLLLAKLLVQVRQIMVRDQRSFTFLRDQLGEFRNVPQILPDLAFDLLQEDLKCPQKVYDDGSIHIAITPLDFQRQNPHFAKQIAYENTLVDVVRRLASEVRILVYVVAQCTGPSVDQDDRFIAERIHSKLVRLNVPTVPIMEFENASQLTKFYNEMSVMIGTRMHSGILALSTGVPVVLISYQPKACGMMEMVHLSRYCISIDALRTDKLYVLVSDALNNHDTLVHHITQRVQELRSQLDQLNRWM